MKVGGKSISIDDVGKDQEAINKAIQEALDRSTKLVQRAKKVELFSKEELNKVMDEIDETSLQEKDQNTRFVEACHDIGEKWGEQAYSRSLKAEEACQGVVNDILKIIDGKNTEMPTFTLVPVLEGGNKAKKKQAFVPESNPETKVNWDYDMPMALRGNLSEVHAAMYDIRHNLKDFTSAKELFD